ncbi:hypothetical protein FB45DRAFT_905382 [Roridomyces roridus]|uniref:Uncharacterized protein n=1 Tax=Roridomyces roridus TaxID=1738132 RepID=A0AAD7C5F0_9AGAR|nr:hypothetical protein FB45DRAFT_905382 [Roridomyces roridus]
MPGPAYACACLNVRITVTTSVFLPPPDVAPTPDFTPVHVADEGISVVHPQVTLRIRTRGELTAGQRRARYTSLTCLVCHVLVYRVHQILSPDTDTRDGPLLPSEDWVEQDLLKSSTGWIEVHKDCLTGDAITRSEKSPQYSPIFSIAIPTAPSPPPSPQPTTIEDGPQVSYLADLPPLFLPPPFTPAHPVFVHLSSLAKAESDAQRAAVESYVANVMRAKSAELAQSESRLRHQVETVWRQFRQGLESVEHSDSAAALASPRSPRSPVPHYSGNMGSPSSPTRSHTPVERVLDFVPMHVPPIRQNRPAALSSLSASLATSSFHHPRTEEQLALPSPDRPESPRTAVSGSSITLAGSPRAGAFSLPRRILDEGASVLQFSRNHNEDINTAASFRLFQSMEEDMARHKQARERQLQDRENAEVQAPVASTSADGSSAVAQAGPSTVNGNGQNHAEKKNGLTESHADGARGEGSSGGKGKQKKVVTFQSQPAVVTIKREVDAEKEEEARRARDDGEEMMFAMEEANGRYRICGGGCGYDPRRRKEQTDSTGLPQSFSALRPASLPVPSHIVRRTQASIPEEDGDEVPEEEEKEEYNSRDLQIRRLVAADIPSHRGAWRRGSDELKALVSGRRDEEEDEDEDEDGPSPLPPPHLNGRGTQAGIPGSLPIAIRPLVKPRTILSLASYRPQTLPAADPEPEPEPEPPISSSSNAIRTALYQERDQQRAMDPGALDFPVDYGRIVEEEENRTASTSRAGSVPESGRGNQRALSILQARNELPDSGMWRSLAS